MDTPFAIWLREERARLRESQGVAAREMGKTRSWVAALEQGRYRPRIQDIEVIAKHFRIDPARVAIVAGYRPDEVAAVKVDLKGGAVLISPEALADLVEQAAAKAARQAALELMADLATGRIRVTRTPGDTSNGTPAEPQPERPRRPRPAPPAEPEDARPGRLAPSPSLP